jgi:hypothetical protein
MKTGPFVSGPLNEDFATTFPSKLLIFKHLPL